MASFAVEGLDELIRQLDATDADAMVDEILLATSDEMIQRVRAGMTASPFHMESILPKVGRIGKIKTDRDGLRYVTVSVKGKHKNGVANALIAFVLNYGRGPNPNRGSKENKSRKQGVIHGAYFWTKATRDTEAAIPGIAEKIMEQYQKG